MTLLILTSRAYLFCDPSVMETINMLRDKATACMGVDKKAHHYVVWQIAALPGKHHTVGIRFRHILARAVTEGKDKHVLLMPVTLVHVFVIPHRNARVHVYPHTANLNFNPTMIGPVHYPSRLVTQCLQQMIEDH